MIKHKRDSSELFVQTEGDISRFLTRKEGKAIVLRTLSQSLERIFGVCLLLLKKLPFQINRCYSAHKTGQSHSPSGHQQRFKENPCA